MPFLKDVIYDKGKKIKAVLTSVVKFKSFTSL